MDIAAWLHSLGLQQYEAAFRDNAIDPSLLLSLTANDLKDLGVNPPATAITALREAAPTATADPPPFATTAVAPRVEPIADSSP